MKHVGPVFLATLTAAAALLWGRSYWIVDKARAQILPKFAVEAQLTPGRITLAGLQSSVPLSIVDSSWSSWPIDSYFADYIPPPAHQLLGEFRFYNGHVTLPMWFLLLSTALLNVALYIPRLARKLASRQSSRLPALLEEVASSPPITGENSLRRMDPLILAGSISPAVPAATAMLVVS